MNRSTTVGMPSSRAPPPAFGIVCLRTGDGWYVPASRVVHLVGRSSGVTTRGWVTPRRPAYWFESRKRYFRRHHGALGALACHLAYFLGYTSWRVRNLVERRPSLDPPCFWRDFAAHHFLPRALRRIVTGT